MQLFGFIILTRSVSQGLCFGTQFDANYGWTGDLEDNFYSFRGYSNSILKKDKETGIWKLSLYANPFIYAICNETGNGYPIGTYNWYFFNDTCTRAGPSETVSENIYKFPLSFSACQESEYTCRIGAW